MAASATLYAAVQRIAAAYETAVAMTISRASGTSRPNSRR
jgi:hypothetical protein